jgi:hypothetical protein
MSDSSDPISALPKEPNSPKEHWVDMPEFTQEKQKPFACVNLRFEDEQALADFCALTGLKLTQKTKSAWYPDRPPSDTGMKRWV